MYLQTKMKDDTEEFANYLSNSSVVLFLTDERELSRPS